MKKLLVIIAILSIFTRTLLAADFSWKGSFRTRTSNYTDIAAESSQDTVSIIVSRFRLYTTATMSENLKAVVGFEIGDFDWGNDGHNHDYKNIETKRAYLEFTPEMVDILTFRVGLQGYTDQFGAAVFDEDDAGIMIMPALEGFEMNAGILVLEDDDVETDSHTLGIIDLSKKMDKLNLKGSLYYDTVRKAYSNIYHGAGADYSMDLLGFGGQFIYMSWKEDSDLGDDEVSGYFAYLYGRYSHDKLSAKINFGYAPADYSGDNPVYFMGIKPYAELYGLEYFFPGSVFDGFTYQDDYGSFDFLGPVGSMVISANLKYDFLFATFGMINITEDSFDDKVLGTEIDLGINYELTEGLSFKAVYAMFMAGDFFADNIENGSEISTQLKYKF